MEPKTMTCPICGSEECYIDSIELEEADVKNIKELNGKNVINSYMCTNCGYVSTNLMIKDSNFLESVLNKMPEILKDMKFYDKERNIYWFLAIVQNQVGRLFPEPNEKDWHWTFIPIVKISEEEAGDYLIPDEEDKYYEFRFAEEQAIKFDKSDFKSGLKKIGLAKS